MTYSKSDIQHSTSPIVPFLAQQGVVSNVNKLTKDDAKKL